MITTLEPTTAPATLPFLSPDCVCPDGSGRTLTSTVPRELVHRAAVAEVFLTGMCRPGPDRFHVRAQLPRGHSFFSPIAGTHYDPMMICETIRQVGSYIAHEAYGVPLGHQFLLWGLDYATMPENLVIGDAPADLDLEVRCSDIRMRGTQLQALRYEVTMLLNGTVIATGDVGYTVTSPAVYRRLRAEQLDRRPMPSLPMAPLMPAQVGRFSPSTWSSPPPRRPRRASPGSSGTTPGTRCSSTTPGTTCRAWSCWRPPARPRWP